MSPREWQTRFEDILTCIRKIQSFTSDELITEFGLEPMRLYLKRARRDRILALEGKYTP